MSAVATSTKPLPKETAAFYVPRVNGGIDGGPHDWSLHRGLKKSHRAWTRRTARYHKTQPGCGNGVHKFEEFRDRGLIAHCNNISIAIGLNMYVGHATGDTAVLTASTIMVTVPLTKQWLGRGFKRSYKAREPATMSVALAC